MAKWKVSVTLYVEAEDDEKAEDRFMEKIIDYYRDADLTDYLDVEEVADP